MCEWCHTPACSSHGVWQPALDSQPRASAEAALTAAPTSAYQPTLQSWSAYCCAEIRMGEAQNARGSEGGWGGGAREALVELAHASILAGGPELIRIPRRCLHCLRASAAADSMPC